MRILLTNHLPLSAGRSGEQMELLAKGLLREGHQVKCFVIDRHESSNGPLGYQLDPGHLESLFLGYDPPTLCSSSFSSQLFFDLSDEQIAQYRGISRQSLNRLVDAFDPQIIHTQHLWVQGSLVLETGIPYLVSAQPEDLSGTESDPRFRQWADQGAENAGRIIASEQYLASAVRQRFSVEPFRVASIPLGIDLNRFAEADSRDKTRQEMGLGADALLLLIHPERIYAEDLLVWGEVAAFLQEELPQVRMLLALPEKNMAEATELLDPWQQTLQCISEDVFELAELYSCADLLLVSEAAHPLSLQALKAVAAGAWPLVDSLVPWLESFPEGFSTKVELPHDSTGKDPKRIGRAWVNQIIVLQKTLAEQPYQERKQAAHKALLENHSLENWINRHCYLYQEILDERFG
ncbi:Hypothetical protein PBC10988_25090 [Planctomycetales bacterium 10988]|nr:Hypothetical protein PBC10988_25090 [Planctomycetales bacterium 10988]